MKKVFVMQDLPWGVLEPLAAQCRLEVWREDRTIPRDELLAQARDANGLLCLLTHRIDEALVSQCESLEFVSSMSVGVDHVDLDALGRRGIPLGNTPGVLVDTTADLNMALLLSAARRIPEADHYVRSGQWRQAKAWYPDMFVGKDLSASTLGIIGLGEIGQAVARRAAGFGMKIIGWTRSGRSVDGVASTDFDTLLEQADFISVNVALTPDTRDLIDAEAIGRMKRDAVLVNTARGGIVDEQALAAALESGALAAAGVDVFAREPVEPDNPLLKAPNVVLAPHIGSATVRTRKRMAELAVGNALAALRGEPMPHCVNPEVYASAGGQ